MRIDDRRIRVPIRSLLVAGLIAGLASSVAAQGSHGGRGHGGRHDRGNKDGYLIIAEQGAGPFGGTVIGEPDSSLHCDHGYVEWQIPPRPRKYPLLMIHASSTRTWETTWDGKPGFKPIFVRRGYPVWQTDLPRTGRAGQGCGVTMYEPTIGRDQTSFTSWRLGIWVQGGGESEPTFYPGVKFPTDDPAALDEFYRIQYPEFNAPENEQVETDALAVLLDSIGPSVLLTHSSTGIRGWITATKSDSVAAIVSYEPGAYVYPEGEVPPDIPRADGTTVSPGRAIPVAEFEKLTRFPIQIVWGDFIPRELDTANVGPLATLDNRRINVVRSQLFAEAVNRHGGNAEVLILPDIGITGNTHFPMLDTNAEEIADLLSDFLRKHDLDERDGRKKGRRETKLATTLTGAEEVPPRETTGRGSFRATIDHRKGELCYVLTARDLVAPVTAAHIHVAPSGVNGPIVVPLEAPTDGRSEACTAVEAELLDAIADDPGAYYVNVHSETFPGGEIRGQLD